VVFCGGCNPRIDRSALAAALRDDATLTTGTEGEVTVHLSGCERACASGHSLTLDGTQVVVVAGECVDGRPAAGHALADTIRRKLEE
jgi:sulfite reductase beta subunit-like hemoprotein